ncbi:MAG: GNAT family protein [Phormidesmis sp.]
MTLPELPDLSVHLRPTQLTDLDFVLTAERHPDNAPYINQWTIEQHQRAIASPDEGHFIAEIAKTTDSKLPAISPIGYTILTGLQDPHQTLLLRRIVTVEKGKGYGRQMLRWVKTFTFDRLGYHRLWLDVVASNQRAKKLYLSEGFVIEGTLREAYKHSQGYKDMLILSVLATD